MLISPYSFCHGWSDTIVYLQTEAAKLRTHWSQPFCRRPQGETLGVLDTLFLILKLIWENTTANAQPITNGMLFLPKGLWSLICLIFFPNTFFSSCLVMSSVIQLVSNFLFTPYVLRQRHGIKEIPSPVTCVILITSKMSSMFFSTAPIPTWFLSAGFMHFCFPQQELTVCLLSWVKTITSFIFFSMKKLRFMRRLAVTLLIEGLFLLTLYRNVKRPCKLYAWVVIDPALYHFSSVPYLFDSSFACGGWLVWASPQKQLAR